VVTALVAHSRSPGIGTILNFGLSDHQGSPKVWGTVLDEDGTFKVLDVD
jgi:hypothetical protein